MTGHVEPMKECPVCDTEFIEEFVGDKLKWICPKCGSIYEKPTEEQTIFDTTSGDLQDI